MDPNNGSTGSSPLTDAELSKDRQSANNNNDDEDGKKQQQSRGAAQIGGQQGQGSRGGKMQPANQGQTWRPVGGAGGLNQGPTGMNAGPLPGSAAGQRYPRPRGPGPSAVQGGGGVGLAGHGGQGLANQGAWPGSSGGYYPRASRYPQPVDPRTLAGGQGLGHYAQQQQQGHLSMGAPVNAYRLMAGMQQAQGGGHLGGSGEQLSKTNLYIRGLSPSTTDRDLYNMCCAYGNINSTKAIIDKISNQCKGYGFVDFELPVSADRALKEQSARGMQVQMAKIRSVQEPNQYLQDADPTNLYLANLSPFMAEGDLDAMLQPYGRVVSTRVLRDPSMKSRGVGFARMETREVCEKVIEILNGKLVAGSTEPLVVKFADSGNRRRLQNRDRNWGRMEHMGLSGYEQLGGGQNGLAGSMMAGIRYSVPPGVGQYSSWQPPYTILPGQLTQMMPGVEGSPYNVSQLAAQMSQLGVNSYNQPYGQYGGYGHQQMYQAGMAQLGGAGGAAGQGGQEEQQGNGLDGLAGGIGGQGQGGVGQHQNSQQQPQNMGAIYSTGYQQQK